MEIILQQDIPSLGYKNDTIQVKPGYARNFLIPRGMAVVASASNKKVAAQNLQQAERKATAIKEQAEAIVQQLHNTTITMHVKAGSEGRIFGTITAAQVADAIQKSCGAVVESKHIHFPKPIKTLGEHTATLNLHREVSHSLVLHVEED